MNQAVAGLAWLRAPRASSGASVVGFDEGAPEARGDGVVMMIELHHQPHAPPLQPIACIIQP